MKSFIEFAIIYRDTGIIESYKNGETLEEIGLNSRFEK